MGCRRAGAARRAPTRRRRWAGGRRSFGTLIATPDQLTGAAASSSSRPRPCGDVTFHGPGQLVAYPIVRLIDHGLSVGGYVHRLEDAIASRPQRAHRAWTAGRDACWHRYAGSTAAKPKQSGQDRGDRGAQRKGATMCMRLALNISTDLSYFDLIVPCGLKGRPVTSLSASCREM